MRLVVKVTLQKEFDCVSLTHKLPIIKTRVTCRIWLEGKINLGEGTQQKQRVWRAASEMIQRLIIAMCANHLKMILYQKNLLVISYCILVIFRTNWVYVLFKRGLLVGVDEIESILSVRRPERYSSLVCSAQKTGFL